jgi:metal-responsive CopG/Arc/MetJ family transcriptional regulator
MAQYTFSSEELLIRQVDNLASDDDRSRSEMIVILLRYAIKEKTRKHGKKVHIKHNASNVHQNDSQ